MKEKTIPLDNARKVLKQAELVYQERITKADAFLQLEIERMADYLQQVVVNPFCDKHQLTLVTGSGECHFCTKEGEMLYPECRETYLMGKAPRSKIEGCEQVIAAILMKVPDVHYGWIHSPLGALMKPYAPKEKTT